MTLNWPKPYTKALNRAQIKLIYRIYLTDKAVRMENGFTRCTRGLTQRLAAEFGVKRRLIQQIAESTGEKRRFFRDIDVKKEKRNAVFKRASRRRYREAIAGARPEQDFAGGE